MITKIKIEGFKSFKSIELELSNINILIGENGTGKSNFISFFELLNVILLQKIVIQTGADKLLYFGRKTTEEIYGKVCFENKNSHYFNLIPIREDDLYFINDKYPINDLMGIVKYRFNDTSDAAPLRQKCEIEDNQFLHPDGSNLPAFLYYIQEKHPKTFWWIEKTIQSIAPYIDKLLLAPHKDDKEIELRWRAKFQNEMEFSVHDLSDGTLRFIALTTALKQPDPPSVIVIDEPELGLHPNAITQLAALIRVVSKQTQVIIATQSVNFVDHFEPKDIITADWQDKQTKLKRLEPEGLEKWLEDFSLGELWERDIIRTTQPI